MDNTSYILNVTFSNGDLNSKNKLNQIPIVVSLMQAWTDENLRISEYLCEIYDRKRETDQDFEEHALKNKSTIKVNYITKCIKLVLKFLLL